MFCIERLADQTVEQKIIFHFGYRYMDGIHFFDNRYINQPWDSNQQLGNNKNRMNEFFHFHSIQVSHKIHLSESYSHTHTHTQYKDSFIRVVSTIRGSKHTHTHTYNISNFQTEEKHLVVDLNSYSSFFFFLDSHLS